MEMGWGPSQVRPQGLEGGKEGGGRDVAGRLWGWVGK